GHLVTGRDQRAERRRPNRRHHRLYVNLVAGHGPNRDRQRGNPTYHDQEAADRGGQPQRVGRGAEESAAGGGGI
ncbi:MAG: hypothetical protein WBF51_06395, partial [Candidatus Dormiibacterota bacterium]